MKVDVDPTSLSQGELVALVNELRQQLAEKEQEIERLKRFVPTGSNQATSDEATTGSSVDPPPGSVADLLAQLEQIYPPGR
jgi:hypothetical protein